MITFDKYDVQRFAISAVGAITLSTACVFAAVAPAKAEAPATLSAWQGQVEQRVARARDMGTAPAALTHADVALAFTADGDFAGARLARTSGSRKIDARAVRVASRLVYPQLPATERGLAKDVTLRLYFGDAANGAVVPGQPAVYVQMADTAHWGAQVAAR